VRLEEIEALERLAALRERGAITESEFRIGKDRILSGSAPSSWRLVLLDSGSRMIHVIKELREITGQGLKECKQMAGSAPAVVVEGMSREQAVQARERLEAAGARTEIQAG